MLCNSCGKCVFFQFNKIDTLGKPRAPTFLFHKKGPLCPLVAKITAVAVTKLDLFYQIMRK